MYREFLAFGCDPGLQKRHLSHRLFDTYDASLDACSAAWDVLFADTGRIASLGGAA